MGNTQVKGKEILVPVTPVALFSLFTNLGAVIERLPAEYREKVTIDGDKVIVNAKGITISFELARKIPFSQVGFKSIESPVPFEIDFMCAPVGIDQTLFHIELDCELNFMMKMMVGGKLQEAVDTISDQIELALKGQMPSMDNLSKNDFVN